MDIIDKIYKDPKSGFLSSNKLYQKIKEQHPEITLKQVKEYLANSSTEQLHTQKRKPKEEAKIYGLIGQYQLDLTFLSQYKKQNKGYHIILVAVEINTRYAYALPIKSKSQDSLVDSLKSLINRMNADKRKPTIFQTDNGTEFKNSKVSKLCEINDIKQVYCQEGDKKCLSIAERFNRTIKNYINKFMTSKNTVVWYDKLDDFINNYNNTYHSTIGMKPKDVNNLQERLIVNSAIEHNSNLKSKNVIQVGDMVRLPLKKSKFEKEGRTFSNETYTVNKVLLTNLTVEGKAKKYRISEVLKVPSETEVVNTDQIVEAKKKAKVKRIVEQKERIEINEEPKKYSARKSKLKAYENILN